MSDNNEISFDFSNPLLYSPIYVPIIHSKKRNILLYGSRDSGKSDFVAGQIIKHLLKEDYCRVLLIRKTFNSIKDSQFQTIKDVAERWGVSHHFSFTTSPLEIKCLINRNKVLCRGLDNPEKTKSIKDPTIAWYEEADEIGIKEWLKTSQSLRAKKGTLLREYFTFNPEDQESYLNKVFFPDSIKSYEREDGLFNYIRSKRKDSVILHVTHKDNLFCPQERRDYNDSLINIDPDLYRMYSLGLWGNARQGLVYPKYNIVKELPEEYDYRIYGVDWGFSNDPKVLVEIRVRSNHAYIKEHIYKTHMRISEFIREMRDIGISEDDPIYCDTNDPENTAELVLAGFYALTAYKGSKRSDKISNVLKGIDYVKTFILNVTEDSENLRGEYKIYAYKTRKDVILNEVKKFKDHGMDAKRYALYTHSIYNNIQGRKL